MNVIVFRRFFVSSRLVRGRRGCIFSTPLAAAAGTVLTAVFPVILFVSSITQNVMAGYS